MSKNWKIAQAEILTRWARDISPDDVLPEYPRPQCQRSEWISLNGLWDYAILPRKKQMAKNFEGNILVPFPVESALSGVKRKLTHKERLWYKRTFKIPNNWNDKRILIHFGAVDWQCEIWVNKTHIGSHKGGYVPFSFDITDSVKKTEENEIIVAVWDPTDKKGYPRGKQKLKAYGIWYTPASGIWQTVWLEPVPHRYIEHFKMNPDIDSAELGLNINVVNFQEGDKVVITAKEGENTIAEISGTNLEDLKVPIPDPKLWSPDSPFLYDLFIQLVHEGGIIDEIQSYFGMRKISILKDTEGNKRLAINNEILFQYGPLDQGYWPDGIYTAPTDEALKYDIEITKELGFNMIRKHVKVEPARWYYWCDKLGVLVWQDMPSGGKTGLLRMVYGLLKSRKSKDYERPKHEQEIYYQELRDMVESFYNYPSIVVWVPFNEGWGQFESEKTLKFVRKLDSSRLIDLASGWFDHRIGDIADCHKYVGPCFPNNLERRVPVCGEFGGLGFEVEGHLWPKKLKFVYKKFKNAKELESFYSDLISKLEGLKQKGLAAAVYTQITDVEGEVNGLLTYDREVLKMDRHKLHDINSSLY
ncbi:MAG: beta-galactosidase [Promethearchaeota archaeon]|nr:MAG: beta-galactosidase [Candidatus Lokiarchaeota archaeon]